MNKIIVDKTTKKQRGGITGKGFLPGQSGNPNGRPLGSKNFSTLFDEVIEDIAKDKKITIEQARKDLIETAYNKARQGNFLFFKDLMDRRFGQPTKPIDITTGGESFIRPTDEERKKALKALKEIE